MRLPWYSFVFSMCLPGILLHTALMLESVPVALLPLDCLH